MAIDRKVTQRSCCQTKRCESPLCRCSLAAVHVPVKLLADLPNLLQHVVYQEAHCQRALQECDMCVEITTTNQQTSFEVKLTGTCPGMLIEIEDIHIVFDLRR